MKNLLVLSFCLLVTSVAAQEPLQRKGSRELERIKGLAGTWVGEVDHGKGPEPVKIVYRITAGGSAVVETFNPSSPTEMVTVYHDSDGSLELTHYCMLGNQPHMKLTASSDNAISLSVANNAGDKDDEMQMSALTIEFKAADKINQKWVLRQGGKPISGPAIELTRQP